MLENTVPSFPSRFLSSRWIKSKFYPNMIPHCDKYVIKVLETGLLFKEDALLIEDALQVESVLKSQISNKINFYLTLSPREKFFTALAVGVTVVLIPFKQSSTIKENAIKAFCWAATGATFPIIQRYMVPNTFVVLLKSLSNYTILLRKCMAYLKNQSLQSKNVHLTSINSINALLIQQQKELCTYLQSLNASLESLFLWMPSSLEISVEGARNHTEDLMKFHHLYLILQSTFLKNVAVAHLTPSMYADHFRKNRNEKIYWMHAEVFPALNNLIDNCSVSLENAYKYVKDNVNVNPVTKCLPKIAREHWQYSEVHTNIIMCSSEIRSALMKCNDIDNFLEACWNAKSKFSPQIFEDDLSKMKKEVMKSLLTIETISVQLKKIHMAEMKILEQAVQKLQLPAVEEEDVDMLNVKSVSEDTEVEIKDQVYYYIKTDNNNEQGDSEVKDHCSGPGQEEIKATKIVLEELKMKLVDREEEMRAREAVALENTMPEYKGKVPNFPRQIKLPNNTESKINTNDKNVENGKENVEDESKQEKVMNVANGKEVFDDVEKDSIHKCSDKDDDSEFSDEELREKVNNFEKSKLLKDIRKYRVSRKKNYPISHNRIVQYKNMQENGNKNDEPIDEGLKPVEYRFGTGMAMATLLHIQDSTHKNKFLEDKEVFIGDGEVSSDSGNEL